MNIVYQTQHANVPAIITSAGIAIPANTKRIAWSIQNVGQNPIFVCMGTTASSSVFHDVIKGGTADSDGLGGSTGESQGVVFTGDIYIAGTTPKVVVLEHAP